MQVAQHDAVVDVITATDQVGRIGQSLHEHAARAGVSDDVAADVRLVAAELATNAFEHGAATEVSISLEVGIALVQMQVKHRDMGIAPDPNDAVMPPPTSERGRGLAIVAVVAATVDRSIVEGITVTDVTFDRTDD